MASRVLVLAVASAALLSLCAAAPTDSLPRRRPTFDWLRRKIPPPKVVNRAGVEQLWFEQKLDHFDSTNYETWYQLYYRNDYYYTAGGPVFLFISGESEASDSWVSGGHMYDLAAQNGALMFLLEHRFYGSSRPTSDRSVRSLRYLNSTQALEDIAYFIRQQQHDDPWLGYGKWVVFGGSYAGNLAAWARLRYPDLIEGAVSSSGPVLAQANFQEYLEVVAEAMETFDPECVTAVEDAMQEFEELLQTSSGISTISELFGLCSELDPYESFDVAGLTSFAANTFSGLAQYNDVSEYYTSTLEENCYQLRSTYGYSALERLTRWMGYGDGSYCIDPDYEYSNAYYQDEEWGYDDTRQWLWQTCTEFGYYQTSDSPNQPFGRWMTLPYFTETCSLIFGSEFTGERVEEGVSTVNWLYGGNYPDVTNVVFVNGGLDPWHRLGVLQDLNEYSEAIVIPYQSHCADMQTASYYDRPEMTEARERIAEWVAWFVS